MREFISNYQEFIKQPVQVQIKKLAQRYCLYHNIPYESISERYTTKVPIKIKHLHFKLRESSVLYGAEQQAAAFKMHTDVIRARVNQYISK